MMRDERIKRTQNRIAVRGFGLWYILLLAALLYRQFYLGQPASEYWDLALIFFIGTLYVVIAGFSQGAIYETSVVRSAKWAAPVILFSIVAAILYQGTIQSLVDLVGVVLSASVGLLAFGLVCYYLYQRWLRKNILEN